MASVLVSTQESGFFNRLLPLRHWLGPETGYTIEAGQARTRLICTFVGLCGFMVAARFAELPGGIIGTAIVFPLYAIALALHIRWRPAPTPAELLREADRAMYAAKRAGKGCYRLAG